MPLRRGVPRKVSCARANDRIAKALICQHPNVVTPVDECSSDAEHGR